MKRINSYHYENTPIQIYTVSPPKTEKFQMKTLIFFHSCAQNIDCGYSLEPLRRGGSNEYPQHMFLSRNKKNNVYPCKPKFYYKKVGVKGVKIIKACFRDVVDKHRLLNSHLAWHHALIYFKGKILLLCLFSYTYHLPYQSEIHNRSAKSERRTFKTIRCS